MDFVTTGAPPVPIRVNGRPYQVPRFLLPEQRAWAAEQAQEQMNQALAQLPDPDARARFCLYFTVPPIDVLNLIEQQGTPEGIEYVLRKQLKAAGVPDEEADAMLRLGDPAALRELARRVGSARDAADRLAVQSDDPGKQGNPQSGRPHTSEGSPATTDRTSPSSPPPSPASTAAA